MDNIDISILENNISVCLIGKETNLLKTPFSNLKKQYEKVNSDLLRDNLNKVEKNRLIQTKNTLSLILEYRRGRITIIDRLMVKPSRAKIYLSKGYEIEWISNTVISLILKGIENEAKEYAH